MSPPNPSNKVVRAKTAKVTGIHIASGASSPDAAPEFLSIQFDVEGALPSPYYSIPRDQILTFVAMIAQQTELMRLRDEAVARAAAEPPEKWDT